MCVCNLSLDKNDDEETVKKCYADQKHYLYQVYIIYIIQYVIYGVLDTAPCLYYCLTIRVDDFFFGSVSVGIFVRRIFAIAVV